MSSNPSSSPFSSSVDVSSSVPGPSPPSRSSSQNPASLSSASVSVSGSGSALSHSSSSSFLVSSTVDSPPISSSSPPADSAPALSPSGSTLTPAASPAPSFTFHPFGLSTLPLDIQSSFLSDEELREIRDGPDTAKQGQTNNDISSPKLTASASSFSSGLASGLSSPSLVSRSKRISSIRPRPSKSLHSSSPSVLSPRIRPRTESSADSSSSSLSSDYTHFYPGAVNPTILLTGSLYYSLYLNCRIFFHSVIICLLIPAILLLAGYHFYETRILKKSSTSSSPNSPAHKDRLAELMEESAAIQANLTASGSGSSSTNVQPPETVGRGISA